MSGSSDKSLWRGSKPVHRRLRGYAFDPSLSVQLDTAVVNQVVFKVDWEDNLLQGPVGEYLEVVDYDPASDCFYGPVYLNHPYILAKDGLTPSEGSPQFHQQMVYAVAMTTIQNFESALGRKAFWSPGRDRKEEFIQRLRVYPHALREANAYYSPDKVALLFGYFPASSDNSETHYPGGIVFTCLSHDIIAHETTHALLDGMHRRFNEPNHPDGLAFHEAFADIVALFQHFSFPEVLRHQIAKNRGDLASQSLLGELAQQFGEAIGNYGALRDAIGRVNPTTKQWEPLTPNPQAYNVVLEPHQRGAILVAAVFDAFISIYKSRVADLFRIATSGTGVLPAGAIHPDLVNRLASEAAKSAQQVLTMCIRALDYCPPVDITFGDYLRALITADSDLVPYDDLGYRVAFIEAFRRRGIYPRDVRTLSMDSLRWPKAKAYNNIFAPIAEELREFMENARYLTDRHESFDATRKMRRELHNIIVQEVLVGHWRGLEELTGLALKPDTQMAGLEIDSQKIPKFEIHSLRSAQRIGPDGNALNQIIISITQKRKFLLDPASPTGGSKFYFRGGCTLILDLNNLDLRYRIVKKIDDEERLAAQVHYKQEVRGNSLYATYFDENDPDEPFAIMHRGAGSEPV